jgi:hypothetical protein
MSVVVEQELVHGSTDEIDDDIDHMVCECNPDIALCGTNVSEVDWKDDGSPPDCVVCAAMADTPCPYCGE